MGADSLKERLHLRIEQADSKMLRVLDLFTETLFAEYYTKESIGLNDEQVIASSPPVWAKPLSKEESLSDIKEGLEEYHRGEYITLDEIDKEAQAW